MRCGRSSAVAAVLIAGLAVGARLGRAADGPPPAASGDGPEWTCLQLSLWDPLQCFPSRYGVRGLGLALCNRNNRSLAGLDLGLYYNRTTGDLWGVQTVGVLGWTEGDCAGLQMGGLGCVTEGDFAGVQIAPVAAASTGGDLTGVQVSAGLAGWVLVLCSSWVGTLYGREVVEAGTSTIRGDLVGAQINGLAATTAGRVQGVQLGLGLAEAGGPIEGWQLAFATHAKREAFGLQTGVLTVADHLVGVQVGVVNWTKRLSGVQVGLLNVCTEHRWPCVPLVNVRL